MATTKEQQTKKYIVSVKDNPTYCGIGAGSVQFANGKATIHDGVMAEWFRSHDGYEVEEAKEA